MLFLEEEGEPVQSICAASRAAIVGEGLTAALTALLLRQREVPFVRLAGGEREPQSRLRTTAAEPGFWSGLPLRCEPEVARGLSEDYQRACRTLGLIAALLGAPCTAVPAWYFSEYELLPMLEEAAAATELGLPAAFVPRPEGLFAGGDFARKVCALRYDGALLLSAADLTRRINALPGCGLYNNEASDKAAHSPAAVVIEVEGQTEGQRVCELELQGVETAPVARGELGGIRLEVTPTDLQGRLTLRTEVGDSTSQERGFAALEAAAERLFPGAKPVSRRVCAAEGEGFRYPELTPAEGATAHYVVSGSSHPAAAMLAAQQAARAAERALLPKNVKYPAIT